MTLIYFWSICALTNNMLMMMMMVLVPGLSREGMMTRTKLFFWYGVVDCFIVQSGPIC